MAKRKTKQSYQSRKTLKNKLPQIPVATDQTSGSIKTPQTSTTITNPTSQITPLLASPTPKIKVLFFIQNSKDGIGLNDVTQIEDQLATTSVTDTLFAVIYTAGGDVYSAVKIMRMLQNKFPVIKIIIPDFVYSAGTIMSLGGNEIYMDVDATLGPLDKPMENFKDGSEISSIDITKTLTNIASICTSIGLSIYKELRTQLDNETIRLGKNDASKIAFDTAAKLICPITEKIDPFNLQKGYRETTIGLYYAIDMVFSRMIVKDMSQAGQSCRKLVNDYPSHGYCIFRDELRDTLKLKVYNLEDLLEWKRIKPTYDLVKKNYIRYLKIEDL